MIEDYNRRHKRDLPFDEWMYGEKSRWVRAEKLGLGEGSSIYLSCLVYNPKNLKVGENTWIGPNTILDASGGLLEIGNYCSISAGVQIYTHDSVKWALSGGQEPYSKAPTKIGSNCFIGPYAVIAKGAVIPDCTIIPAHSLIKKVKLNED
jgi:acetyltransferase-like isoleucine patch superfamily enzyme